MCFVQICVLEIIRFYLKFVILYVPSLKLERECDGALETIIGFTFFRAVVVLLDVETIETLFPVTFCMPLALFDPEFFCICVLGLHIVPIAIKSSDSLPV